MPRTRGNHAEAIYDAALGEQSWEAALRVVSDEVGGASLLLSAGHLSDPGGFAVWEHDLDRSLVDSGKYSASDGADAGKNPGFRAGFGAPLTRSFDIRARIGDAECDASPFWRSFMLPQGFVRPRIFALTHERGWVSGGFASFAGREMDRREVARLDRVLPHLARGLRLWAEIGRLRSANRSLEAALDLMEFGVLLVDSELRILFCNACASDLLSRRNGLGAALSRLRITAPPQHRELQDAIARIARPEEPWDGVPPASIAVPRPGGLPPLALSVFPATAGDLPGRPAASAIVMVSDPARNGALPDPALLADLWGLTPAEARVAQLAPLAMGRRQIAALLGLSENTVKSHLTAIREKLGAHSMAELGAIVRRAAISGRSAPG